ncbi:hypothetical protein SDRG_05511 [Saprolegnia diclina VS20]|uniref:Hpc2-related domain-containing protein n=1 Tax=Saprolegnia diclina (strain VS20) TaxID=1156394 RepID=T0S3G0_SAPDV|nr:hypothetical protein SDRG_05511 [Saprolegnia diclina VS20]EQC37287.1 hypothetical protein SDRG_05511 [Saprolegnia diclina VS20]|eukprot:XP_008609449.1 hypothetical protein SDRG_05511 [Saprolegnia diclina VS20]
MRLRFHVSLDASNEISFKALKATLGEDTAPVEAAPTDASALPHEDGPPSTPPLVPARPSRGKFNIIEHLEQRYGRGGPLDMKDTVVRKNVDHDDLYDSDDSFIDDTDLHESIESTYSKTQVKTKHSGFFVNAGDRIETIKELKAAPVARGVDNDDEPLRKKSKKHAEEMDDWGDEWQPGAEVDAVVAKFREFVASYFAEHGTTKAWPPAFDDGFRDVDRTVVNAHPQRWRVNGYITSLMQFLPYTKTSLRGHMARLEARDHARQAKTDADDHFLDMAKLVEPHKVRAEESDVMSVDGFKEDVLKDTALAVATYSAAAKMEDWVTKENEYRQLLKQDDKKHLDEAETVILSVPKERNRLYTKMVGCFPTNSIDMAVVRDLVKLGRKESGHSATPHVTPLTKKAGATAASATGAAKKVLKTPKPPKAADADKVPDAATKAPAPAPKRPAKPIKARRFEVCPVWSPHDFIERKVA